MFGYDMGAISGALPPMARSFHLSETQQEWVVSILYLGGGVGASVGGTLCDKYGRQRTIVGTDVIFLLGALWLYTSHSYASILMGRFLLGTAVAVSGVADVSYLHEMAPRSSWRGAMVSVQEACISLGFLLAYVAGYVYTTNDSNNNNNIDDDKAWRNIFAWSGILALIQFVGMWNMPESPVWLAQQEEHGRRRRPSSERNNGMDGGSGLGEATATTTTTTTAVVPSLEDDLIWQRQWNSTPRTSSSSSSLEQELPPDDGGLNAQNQDEAGIGLTPAISYQGSKTPDEEEFHSFESLEPLTTTNGEVTPMTMTTSRWSRIWLMIRMATSSLAQTLSRYRRQTYIALFLATTQQLCGQTNVLNYAPTIFAQAASGLNRRQLDGMDTNTTTTTTSAPTWAMLCIGGVKVVVTALVIWKIESVGRRTLLLWGMTLISIGMFALIVAFGGTDNPESWSNHNEHRHRFQLALPGVLLVVCGYSMSFGPLTWLLTSELFPTEIRGRALGASTIVTYLCASLVTRTFLSTSSFLGPSKVFGIYCIINTMGIVFSYLAIPDTGEKTVEEIEDAIHAMWWWRYDFLAQRHGRDEMAGMLADAASPRRNSGETNDESQSIELRPHPNLRELVIT